MKKYTYEEKFGIEKANKIKQKMSNTRKGMFKNITLEQKVGLEKANKIKQKISNLSKGKTYEERYGKEKAEKIKKKISKAAKGITYEERYGKETAKKLKAIKKGKTYEEMYGEEKAKEIKKILSSRKGIKLGTLEEQHGNKKANEIRKKLKKWKPETLIYKINEIFKIYGQISKVDLDKRYKEFGIGSRETIRKCFGSIDKFAEYAGINFKECSGCIGQNESFILHKIENQNNIKLLKQHIVNNFKIDGYDPINNVAYEVDEPHHKFQKEYDQMREDTIKEKLGCAFVRINEQKFLNDVLNKKLTDF